MLPAAIRKNLYNAFDPSSPLSATDPAYVNCSCVRGEENILLDLGQHITLSDRVTHQLYTGHRGAGKSTELLRLKADLEQQDYCVVYFAAEEADLDPEDCQYTDILLACTHNLLKQLNGDQSRIQSWLQSRATELVDAMQGEVSLEGISMETPFAKLMAAFKVSPTTRAQIRKIVEPHTPTLVEALNGFIEVAMKSTPQKTTNNLVLIVDSLDRIPLVQRENEASNHEQIFIHRSEQLKMLQCHVIYTVPIALIYSDRGTDARDIYGSNPQVLPMVMVRDQQGNIYEPGLAVLRELIGKRVYATEGIDPTLMLVGDIFDEAVTLDNLCLMSGGHLRNLMLMMRETLQQTTQLPMTKQAARRAITQARNGYRNAVYDHQWDLLAQVFREKDIRNNEIHRDLLSNRCVLEYRYFGDDDELICWRDVHPLLHGVKEFQAALEKLDKKTATTS